MLRIVSGFASFAAWHRLLQIWEMVIQRGWSPTFARTSGWAEKRHAEGLVADLRSHLCMACGLRPIPCGCYSLWVVPGWLRKRPGWLRKRPGWLRKRPLRIVSGFASFAAWHRLLQIWEMYKKHEAGNRDRDTFSESELHFPPPLPFPLLSPVE